ncbi:MAG: glycosyltransferase family 2 protein [Pirellula sp.]
MVKLIIQIPCLNEAETLHRVISDLPVEIPGIDCIETLVIDDGSSDGTAATALGLGVHHVVRHRRNRGLAAAFSTGLQTALAMDADIIVNTDGDHQYPGHYVTELVQPILRGDADVVIGDRKPEDDERQPRSKRLLYRIGRLVVSWILGERIPDPVSGFRAYTREAACGVRVIGRYSYTLETLVQAVEQGLVIKFVPIQTNASTRESRLYRTHFQFVSRSAVALLRTFFMYHPLQTLLWVSATLAFIGSIPIARFVIFYSAGQGQGHLQSLVLGVGCILMSGIVFVAGIIAELVTVNGMLRNRISMIAADARKRVSERRSELSRFTNAQEIERIQELQEDKLNGLI